MVTALDQNQSSVEKTSLRFIKGIGEKRAAALTSIGIHSVRDLLYYFPRRYLDRSKMIRMKDLKRDTTVTVVGKIVRKGIYPGRRKRFIATLSDDTGYLQCVWFNQLKMWDKMFKSGQTLAVSGKIGYYGGYQLVHPEFDRISDDTDDPDELEQQFLHTGMIIPLYPSSETLGRIGLDSRGFRKAIHYALRKHAAEITETLSQPIIKQQRLLEINEALSQIHFPQNQHKLTQAQRRLKFDELFYIELLLAYRKRQIGLIKKGIEFKVVGERTAQLIEKLPFELTDAQKNVLRDIRADMKKPHPMHRLIQGDVGSGKTIVALISMIMAVENGYQAAIMAPTEILAEQHFSGIRNFLKDFDLNINILIGAQKVAQRRQILQEIESGDCHIVVGTHALIQEGVSFNNLGFVVIDEQHRFGVVQRANLLEKGLTPDVLVMTATPIPRTLSLTVYGDLDVSIIDEMPKGRKPIKTTWRSTDKRDKIYQFVKEQVQQGQQAYVVFPLVEESEKMDLEAATESYEKMSQTVFSDLNIALLHGRMKSEEKDAVMADFKSGKTQILVSTTVIEVGVDVANATIMVIEHAERFGLPQLHQLRGRVGRGSQQSFCILIAQYPFSADALTRLNTMVKTTDGFKIAEVDLRLRGPGEFFGTRQHGMPELQIANPVEDVDILIQARKQAFKLVHDDPQLLNDENQSIHQHFASHYKDKLNLLRAG